MIQCWHRLGKEGLDTCSQVPLVLYKRSEQDPGKGLVNEGYNKDKKESVDRGEEKNDCLRYEKRRREDRAKCQDEP